MVVMVAGSSVRAGERRLTPKNIMNVIRDVTHVMELVDMSLSW